VLAVIQKTENGYIARFERHLKHSVEKVWSSLTENDKLAKWFPELRVVELREGGTMQFAMPNGTVDELQITELIEYSVLEYTWWGDGVRFELYPEAEGCRLVLIRKLNTVTDHTPKDLTGWHVCLDVINALLNGTTIERKEEWKKWYEKYIQAVAEATGNQQ
jgi:uncharacterized protein YndB with AHSA1/START domain